MSKIFVNAEEKNVGCVVVYGHTDNKLYVDAAKKTVLKSAIAVNLFKKGLLLIEDTDKSLYKPVAAKVSGNAYDITVVNGTGSTATFKVFKTA